MNDKKMREEFEAWAATHYLLKECVTELEDDEYCDPEMQYGWESWQASRESLVIELPESWRSAGSTHELMHKRDTVAAIEDAGVKVMRK